MRKNPSDKRTKSLGHHATATESCQDLRHVQLTVFANKNECNEVVQILPHKRFATILLPGYSYSGYDQLNRPLA